MLQSERLHLFEHVELDVAGGLLVRMQSLLTLLTIQGHTDTDTVMLQLSQASLTFGPLTGACPCSSSTHSWVHIHPSDGVSSKAATT